MSTEIPAGFLERMQALLGVDYPAFEESLKRTPVSGLRANPLKVSPIQLTSMLGLPLEPVPWCPSGYSLPELPASNSAPSLGKHPYHSAGLYYLQDPTAMAAVEILDPQPGERILVLAAAPGGKSTHIVSMMENEGLLVANEIVSGRVWELAENLERWGAANTMILNESPANLANRLEGFFDRVLIDAPCSGEGMFRKGENARRDWSPELVSACALRQGVILGDAARLVRPGGVLVYSTCTFSPEENEAVVVYLLQEHPELELERIEPRAGFSPPLVEGFSGTGTFNERDDIFVDSFFDGIVRLWPHRVKGEGHFVARLRRSTRPNRDRVDGGKISRRLEHRGKRHERPARLPAGVLSSFLEFCDQVGLPAFTTERLVLVGSYLYQTIEGAPNFSELNAIHPGLWLGIHKTGEGKRSRFVPAHALALCLKPDQLERSVALDYNLAIRYLLGHPIDHPGSDGWVLICFERFPLGWGKRVNGVVKNYYPKGLRWKNPY